MESFDIPVSRANAESVLTNSLASYVYGKAHVERGRPRGFARQAICEAASRFRIEDGGRLPGCGYRIAFSPYRCCPDSAFRPWNTQACAHRRVPETSGCEISMRRRGNRGGLGVWDKRRLAKATDAVQPRAASSASTSAPSTPERSPSSGSTTKLSISSTISAASM